MTFNYPRYCIEYAVNYKRFSSVIEVFYVFENNAFILFPLPTFVINLLFDAYPCTRKFVIT